MGQFWGLYIILAIIIGSAIYNYFFGRKGTIRRNLKKFQPKTISSIKIGDKVKLHGHVRFGPDRLKAPLSKRECVFYQVKVEERKSKSTSTIISEEKYVNFTLEDNNFTILVDTSNAYCHLVQDRKDSSGFLDNANREMEELLRSHNEESTGLFGMNRSLKYYEGVLEEGEEITVAGKVAADENGRDFILKADKDFQVYISDDPSFLKMLP